ncbi:hypothetical protein AVEN_162277-1 [Araneus ventricosus]|uniref:DUF4817 domain-containing protein n=1 Tax=Araneus ventricosus TaxID=182803 RepID=A0A4Y2FQW5_ARAVE|nr:hypothetical protein AVEN_93007-1 [Araneus ventricosus]GBM42877.1 hypothetical protein AVEN_162277-1 [Araneus ventricosus]
MSPPLDGPAYLVFLQQVLKGLLSEEQVPQSLCYFFWFQHDEAPVHFSLEDRRHLNVNFPQRWIGRGGLVLWPARSPDLSCPISTSGVIPGLSSSSPAGTVKRRTSSSVADLLLLVPA